MVNFDFKKLVEINTQYSELSEKIKIKQSHELCG